MGCRGIVAHIHLVSRCTNELREANFLKVLHAAACQQQFVNFPSYGIEYCLAILSPETHLPVTTVSLSLGYAQNV